MAEKETEESGVVALRRAAVGDPVGEIGSRGNRMGGCEEEEEKEEKGKESEVMRKKMGDSGEMWNRR